jgi:hypothetical protein
MFEAASSKNPLSERLIKINIQLSHVKLDKMSFDITRPSRQKNFVKKLSKTDVSFQSRNLS